MLSRVGKKARAAPHSQRYACDAFKLFQVPSHEGHCRLLIAKVKQWQCALTDSTLLPEPDNSMLPLSRALRKCL